MVITISDYIQLLNAASSVNEKQTLILENIINEFPYFQSARALYLKGLYNHGSFRYNFELKKTAAYTTDRSVLFEFITSENFHAFRHDKFEEIQNQLKEIIVQEFEVVEPEVSLVQNVIIVEAKEVNEVVNAELNQELENKQELTELEQKLEIGKPLEFEKNETHSFSEWLKLAQLKPIERKIEENQPEVSSDLEKKFELIEKFIESNPKIIPVKEPLPVPVNIAKSNESPSNFMTETLAKIYLEQKKYTKAIQAYEILILKYPEKSSFFADRIKDIKQLQQNN